MTRWYGRVRAAALFLASSCALSPSTSVLAQDDEVISDPELGSPRAGSRKKRSRRHRGGRSSAGDEVIADPELQNTENPAKTLRGGEEVIVDPELSESPTSADDEDDNGWGDVYKPGKAAGGDDDDDVSSEASPPREDEHDPMANTGISRLQAFGQFGSDLRREDNLEDAYETRLRFDAEVDFRRSRKTRVSIGVRTDLLWAVPYSKDRDLRVQPNPDQFAQDRFELDILPISAYVDVTPANGFHMRIGEQPVSIARMDFYSPIDMLAAFDMRGQPGLGQSTGKLAQPAVRVDWDVASWATLQVVYLPWFMPNLVRPNRDRYVSTMIGTSGASLPRSLDKLIDPGFQTKANEDSLRFVGPAPDFTTPQAQARLNMRGNGFEVGVSAGSALEKLPSIYSTPTLEGYLRDPDAFKATLFQSIDQGAPVVDVAYHRYQQFGLDGSLELAPLNLGFELTFSPSRHLVAALADAAHIPQPNVSEVIINDGQDGRPTNVRDKSIRKGVPMIQGALHADWIHGETFAIAIEGFMVKVLELPYDRTRDWLGFVPLKGIYGGGLLGATYRPNPDEGRWRFDATVVSLVGPSIIVMPQVEYRLLDTLYVNLGAQIFEGPTPTRPDPDRPGQKEVATGGAQGLNVGGLFSGYDQAYVGFRFVP